MPSRQVKQLCPGSTRSWWPALARQCLGKWSAVVRLRLAVPAEPSLQHLRYNKHHPAEADLENAGAADGADSPNAAVIMATTEPHQTSERQRDGFCTTQRVAGVAFVKGPLNGAILGGDHPYQPHSESRPNAATELAAASVSDPVRWNM